jgi:plasmid stability protein
MPDITIHDVPQDELAALELRAARHGRSAEAEVMHLIHEAAGEERLVTELERATKAVEARLASTRTADAAPRRRYRTVEPTPRRKRE